MSEKRVMEIKESVRLDGPLLCLSQGQSCNMELTHVVLDTVFGY